MTPGGLRAQYLIPNLTPKCECLSIDSSLPLGPRHHAIPWNHRKQFLCRTEAKLSTASISAESFEEILLRWTRFFTKSGPQIRLPPVPIFGVNNLSTARELLKAEDSRQRRAAARKRARLSCRQWGVKHWRQHIWRPWVDLWPHRSRGPAVWCLCKRRTAELHLSLTESSDYQIVLLEYLFVGAKISFSVWVNSEMQYIEQIGIICK
jgi:hypothetical protein